MGLSVLEKNNIIKKGLNTEPVKEYHINLEDFIAAKRLMNINSVEFTAQLNDTDNAYEFYEANEIMRELIPNDKKEEIFYALKLGFFFEGVPTKLTYLLKLGAKAHKYPNVMISSLNANQFDKYLTANHIVGKITILDIINSIYGHKCELLGKYKKRVVNNQAVEYYVPNTDRVLVVSPETAEYLSTAEDINALNYVKDVGVCIRDIPVRTLGGKIGLTVDEYDLREVI